MLPRKESKLRSKRYHELTTNRFQKTQKESSATRPTKATGRLTSASSFSRSDTSAITDASPSSPSIGSPGTQVNPPPTKRVITMSQLRKAAMHASLTSPIKRLAAASPLAKRIRQEILKSGEIKRLEMSRSLEQSPRASTALRLRLQESRFRGRSPITSTVSSLVSSQFCSSHNTPLARYTSFFCSPPPSQTRRPDKSLSSLCTDSFKNPSPSTTSATKTVTHSTHRSLTSRSPLKMLFAASDSKSSRGVILEDAQSAQQSTGPISEEDGTATLRRNLDKRTARILYGPSFRAEIAKMQRDAPPVSTQTPDRSVPGGAASSVTVAIRKRPLFPSELARGDFDVVATHGTSCTIYKTSMEADMKTKTVTPIAFPCSAAFGEANSTVHLFDSVIAALLTQCLQERSSLTVLMFGQTGSGKSYTMTGIEQELVQKANYPFTLRSLEVSGKICRDLLLDGDDRENQQKSQIRIVDQGATSVVGAQSIQVQSPRQLAQLLATVKSRRAICATDKNLESSRSHVLCTLDFPSGGSVTLVDCAGTERKNDSLHHSKDRRLESAEINTSLYALKECIRARASTSPATHIPYRASILTRILRPYLDGHLVVIATIAPNATDTEHTLQTLDTVLTLTGASPTKAAAQAVSQPGQQLTSPSQQPRLIPPKRWTREQLRDFLQSKHLLGSAAIPLTLNGAKVMRFNKLQISHVLHLNPTDAEKLFYLLRAETSRIDRLDLKKRLHQKRSSMLA